MTPPPRLLTLILAAMGLPACAEVDDGFACMYVAADTTACPPADEVDPDALFDPNSCDDNLRFRNVEGEGELREQTWDTSSDADLECCYQAQIVDPNPRSECAIGRPWRDGQRTATAPSVPRADWTRPHHPPTRPDPARAHAWARAAAGEHASVAAFARLALELLAHGAPADLLRAVTQAGLDEIDHAERCYTLASRFRGAPVGPGPLPCAGPVDLGRSLAEIAAEAVRDGCIEETLGAILGRTAAEACEDPDIRADLLRIAADEEAHAALSWRLVAWALRAGGPEVRAAVARAFRAPAPALDLDALALRCGVAREALQAAVDAGHTAVIGPATQSLLAA